MKLERYKNSLDYSYALGISLVIEVLTQRPKDVLAVYYSSNFDDGEGKEKINALCAKLHITPILSDKVFHLVSEKENVYTIAVFKKFKNPLKNGNQIVLVNPSNAGNLGTIVRASLGFGLNNIAIIRPSADVFDPKAIRSSMGAVFKLNFSYFNSFEEYRMLFKSNTPYPFMLQSNTPLKDAKFKEPYALIFGNEATGLDRSYLEYESIIIPHSKEIDSLNLPIACSIAMYAATKDKF